MCVVFLDVPCSFTAVDLLFQTERRLVPERVARPDYADHPDGMNSIELILKPRFTIPKSSFVFLKVVQIVSLA